ncbi:MULTISPECIES: YMGG-like glycine zipper-containing protein [unclassified Sphingosinithalassobacter]|uniref:YMGG-like glycine zipper-containing protein n=1 Tax=unclassified Sphingosinithalassobacter TaxID=2676235 RepID=UPI00165D379D|nr:glycine zipper 2TM domain-containing protein [Sphingosinithalassobacter sp. CS137]
MRKSLVAAAALSAMSLPLAGCADNGVFGPQGALGSGGRVYNPGPDQISDDTVIYRDAQGNYYCRRENGTTGTLVGAGAGALLGNLIAPGGSKTVGALIGGAAGAAAGRAIDRTDLACQ